MRISSLKFYIKRPWVGLRRIAHAFYEWKHPDEPWLAQGAVRFLDETLTTKMKVFEWGSGRSTLWLCQRSKEIVSIEYNEEWAQKVENMLQTGNVDNATLRYIPLDHDRSLPTPLKYDPIPKYVEEIFKYPKESFDLVIVDGHYRPTCVEECLPYIAKGGYILIDNSNRQPRDQWRVPMDWPLVHESENVMTRTSIWQKP